MKTTLHRFAIFAAAALLASAIGMKPLHVYAMGTDNPQPPADDSSKKKKKKDSSVIEQ